MRNLIITLFYIFKYRTFESKQVLLKYLLQCKDQDKSTHEMFRLNLTVLIINKLESQVNEYHYQN